MKKNILLVALFGLAQVNDYFIGPNQSMSIPDLGMTKVVETSLGKEFVKNIRDAQEYSFEVGGKLNIKTAEKTLTFQKL